LLSTFREAIFNSDHPLATARLKYVACEIESRSACLSIIANNSSGKAYLIWAWSPIFTRLTAASAAAVAGLRAWYT